MIRLVPGLPPNVVGIEGVGDVSSDDFKTVVVPALEQAAAAYPKVRLMHVLPRGYKGYSVGARWLDAKVAIKHLRRFERIAVVTDAGWIGRTIAVLGWTVPGEVRAFPTIDRVQAEAWIIS